MKTLSIIIVNYNSKKVLLNCLESIKKSLIKTDYEILIVDNDEIKNIRKDLKRFNKIKYIPNINKGFGQANNIGAKKSSGKYLLFLNPDTLVFKNTIDSLMSFIKDKKADVVAPVLLDRRKKIIPLQGSRILTPISAVLGLSFIKKMFPNNPVFKKLWFLGADKSKPWEVDVVPGTAFLIKKELFLKLKGFDENFFLYFEEFDLFKRAKEIGCKIFINPQSKIVHLWGESTKGEKKIKGIFENSRFYYFKKHFGLTQAVIVELFLRFNRKNILLLIIIAIGLFLRSDRIGELMIFIGDQGWFYLSAKNIFSGNIPLVGITSSHTWLHQGPLWTYILAISLFFGKFNPVSGAFLSILIDIGAIFLIYKVGKDFFSEKMGFVSAVLYATSPLVILNARMPYHTSPIPFLVLLLIYSILKWIGGNSLFFVVSLLSISLLYNFELATVVFAPVLSIVLLIGFLKQLNWFNKLKSREIIFYSLAALIIPMIPVLIYDTQNGFPQTIKFGAWFFYKFGQLLGLFETKMPPESIGQISAFFLRKYRELVFIPSIYFSLLVLVASIFLLLKDGFKKVNSPVGALSILIIVPLLGFIASRTSSDAYLPMLFPGLIISLSYLFIKLNFKFVFALVILLMITFSNIYFLYSNNFFTKGTESVTLFKKEQASREILEFSNNVPYNLKFSGPGSEFESSIMNYSYLTWFFGNNPPSITEENIQIIVSEKGGEIPVVRTLRNNIK